MTLNGKANPNSSITSSTYQNYDYLIKLVMVGDAGVGKTNLVWRFCDGVFADNYTSTIGVDFKFRTFDCGESIVKLQLWDTAGQERFRTITSAYYRGAQGLLLCYDITNRPSFEHLLDWISEIRRHTASFIMLVGCKIDLHEQRVISESEADAFAKKYSIEVCEVSAKEDHNVQSLFKTTTTSILLKLKDANQLDMVSAKKRKEKSESMNLSNKLNDRNRNGQRKCCK